MYCKKCGAEVVPGRFCTKCGQQAPAESNPANDVNNVNNVNTPNPVVTGDNGNNTPNPPVNVSNGGDTSGAPVAGDDTKKSKTPLIIIICVVCALLVGVAGVFGFSFLKNSSGDVEKFAKNLQEEKWQNVYDQMFVADTDYVTFERFSEICEADASALGADFSGASDYNVSELGEVDGNKKYKIVGSNDEELEVTLELVKDGPLSFDTYRITTPACVSFTLTVPENSKVKFEGKDVAEGVTESGATTYNIYPLLPGDYELDIENEDGNKYGTYVTVTPDSSVNTLALTADEINEGKEKKSANEYTTEDVEAFFYKMLKAHNGNSLMFFFAENEKEINELGIEWFALPTAEVDSKTTYTSKMSGTELSVSDIMTKEEFDKLDSSASYKVYKVAELQKKIDELWVPGRFSVEKIARSSDLITSKGYLLYNFAPSSGDYVVFYGEPAKCVKDGDTKFVLDAYMIYYNPTDSGVYDFATDINLSYAQIKTDDTSVNFNSIKDTLGLQLNKINTVTFTFEATNSGIRLVGADEPNGAAQSQQAVVQQTPSVSGDVSYCSTYNMYVKAQGGLNLRLLPTQGSGIITNIPNYSMVTVRGYSPSVAGWYYVSYGSYYGWVSSAYLTTYNTYNAYSSGGYGTTSYYTVRAQGGLNMRTYASTGAGVILTIPNGASVQVYEIGNDGWANVYYRGYEGYVVASYLTYSYTTY